MCITEGYEAFFSKRGYVISAEADYGYKTTTGRRKGTLWSRHPWSHVDAIGHPDLPAGRFVSGVTELGGAKIQVMSLCIPWMNAHVATGRKDRRPWQDHLTYIESISELLAKRRRWPLLVMGDFNQRIPRDRSPVRVYEPLMAALGSRLTVATKGQIAPLDRPTVCHVVHGPGLKVQSMQAINNHTRAGRLSDHFGLVADVVAIS